MNTYYGLKFMIISCGTALRQMPQNTLDDNIGSGNNLVLSGNKLLPEPMSTQIYIAIWRDYTAMMWMKKRVT